MTDPYRTEAEVPDYSEKTPREPWWTSRRQRVAGGVALVALFDAGLVMANWGHIGVHEIGIALCAHVGAIIFGGLVTVPLWWKGF